MPGLVKPWLMLVLLGLCAAQASGAVVRDLYAAEVPVANRSEAALVDAASAALAQVLVKVSGSTAVLAEPAMAELLAQPRQYVEQFSYHRSDTAESGLVANLQFDERSLRGLIAEAGVPLWTANRPTVLLWLVAEGPGGRYFVNRETDPELSRQLTASLRHRGVPVELPLFDLIDTANIGPDEAWRLSGSALKLAASRYDSTHILAGRLAGLSTGRWIGDWSYLSDSGRIDRSYTTDSADAFVTAGAHLVAETLADRYAVVPLGGSGESVLMTVDGIDSFADYLELVRWLEGLEMVRRADLQQLVGRRATLRLATSVSAAQLAPSLELNRRLRPGAGVQSEAELVYLWQN